MATRAHVEMKNGAAFECRDNSAWLKQIFIEMNMADMNIPGIEVSKHQR